MPSTRRVKVVGLLLFATILILLYLTSGASQTRTSEFYTRTVAAIDTRHRTQAKEAADLEQKNRVQELQKLKNDVESGKEELGSGLGSGKKAPDSPIPGAGAGAGAGKGAQKPLAEEVGEVAKGVKEGVKGAVKSVEKGVKDAVHGVAGIATAAAAEGEKSVAGRKMMKDDGSGKIVKDDGVAKVGNTGQKEAAAKSEPGPDTKEDHQVEVEFNDILKKSPSEFIPSDQFLFYAFESRWTWN